MKKIRNKITIAIISLLSIYSLGFGNKGSLPSDLDEFLRIASEEQKDSLYAMHELVSFHESPYGVGETFDLQTSNAACENVTIQKVLGGGGSKKAVLLTDGRVLMLPNMDVDYFGRIAMWWPKTVDGEAAMAQFLEKIGVPALNREKGYLIIPSKTNSAISYKLPVLVADSFEQYANRGWFIMDVKNPESSFYPEEWQKSGGITAENWEKTFYPLMQDIVIMNLNGIAPGTDSHNVVLMKGEDGSFHLRYFGFDFGGKHRITTPPSEETRLQLAKRTDEEICETVPWTAFFIIGEIVNQYKGSVPSEVITKHFLRCEFITEMLNNLNLPNRELTEL